MIRRRRFWIAAGLALSIVLAGLVFTRLDWAVFWRALADVNVVVLLLAALPFSASIMLRALRWTYVTREPPRLYGRFWAATVLGYLGNYIYPLRAGELIRIIALNRLARVPIGQGTASAVVDRLSDGIMLGSLILVVLALHSSGVLGMGAVVWVVGFFLVGPSALVLFALWGHRLTGLVVRASAFLPGLLKEQTPAWYAQALDLVRSYQRLRALLPIVGLTVLVYVLDILTLWIMFSAFGWSLPLTAALTLEVFLEAGSTLPSAPSYVGIYQATSILALGLYDIDSSSAVALSVVLQLLFLSTVLLKSGWVAYHFKLRSSALAVSHIRTRAAAQETSP